MRETSGTPLVPADGHQAGHWASHQAGHRAGHRADGAWRVAAVAILLAVTVVGLRTNSTFSHTPNSTVAGASGTVLLTVLAAAEGIALVAFIVVLAMARPQRQPKEEDAVLWRPSFPFWAKTFAVLAAVAALITPLVVLFIR